MNNTQLWSGYASNVLWVDLTKKQTQVNVIKEDESKKFIGGTGLAAKILWDETSAQTEPLSPKNPLIFMIGPLTGTPMLLSSRYTVAGISPLTGIWGEAQSGGDWADELKHSGFDGIVIKGRSQNPVYLWVHDGEVEIRDANHLWGTDTYVVQELLRKETDPKASVVAIGQAGEKLVRIACIMNDGKRGRAAARCGLGALMGSKHLKAIAVRGTLPNRLYKPDELKKSLATLLEASPPRKPEKVLEGTVTVFNYFLDVRGPTKNWSEGPFEEARKIAEDVRGCKLQYCRHCPYGDGESLLTKEEERHMVWEWWAPAGTNCLIHDIEALQESYTLCNKYGLDTISTGGVLSFAIECYEKGIINQTDTKGIEMKWGNAEAMVEMVRQIGEHKGFGALLGQGVKKAAEQIGGLAPEYAIHVKGLEMPAHDPRSDNILALKYATGNTGADHCEAESLWIASSRELAGPLDRDHFGNVDKGALAMGVQDFGGLMNALSLCMFLFRRVKIQPSNIVALLNLATGWNMSLQEFLTAGERIFNLKRMINVRRGISRKDDTLPSRILTHKRGKGKASFPKSDRVRTMRIRAAEHLPHLGVLLNDYYSVRGWSEEGIPTAKKLKELDLDFTIS